MFSPLLTDLYQLTMSYGYWKERMYDREAVFHLYYRRNPFKGAYAIACGLGPALEWLNQFRFTAEEVQYLGSLNGANGKPLFDEGYLNYLQRLELTVNIDAIPEGTVVFANEPLLRVQGDLLQCQLIETALLNYINFSTLIATKASRMVKAAGDGQILEFGLRRAQGPDGAMLASRAAYVGGCHATSNVLAGMKYGIPVRGTHAHSWVMSFDTEMEAFSAYASAMPSNCVFLVDTYNTLEGVENAITIGLSLRQMGHELLGIRLDSGDMASLSIQARKMLDEAGLPKVRIVASNDLDEYEMEKLKSQGARVDIWGVGTRLVTGHEQSALGGVYKLGALRNLDGGWDEKVKHSDSPEKSSTPGILQVRRYEDAQGKPQKDLLYDVRLGAPEGTGHDLLQPVLKNGKLVAPMQSAKEVRETAKQQMALFEGLLPEYALEIEPQLKEKKDKMLGLA